MEGYMKRKGGKYLYTKKRKNGTKQKRETTKTRKEEEKGRNLFS